MTTRDDVIRGLAAAIREAQKYAADDWSADEDVNRDLDEFVAERLIRYLPAEGLSLRLDDGSEIPA